MEGLEVMEVVMYDYQHYGRMLTEQWQSGEGFVLVEEDIAPWPGAITELIECEHECCSFEYPNGDVTYEPRSGWCQSLGCIKFSDSLVQRVPFGQEWASRGWNELDGAVFETLHGQVEVHLHAPPLAHVKSQALMMRRP